MIAGLKLTFDLWEKYIQIYIFKYISRRSGPILDFVLNPDQLPWFPPQHICFSCFGHWGTRTPPPPTAGGSLDTCEPSDHLRLHGWWGLVVMTVTARSQTTATCSASRNTCKPPAPPPCLRTHIIKRLRSMSVLRFPWWRQYFFLSCPHIVPERTTFLRSFARLRFIKQQNNEARWLQQKHSLRGSDFGGQLLQPPTVVPPKPPNVCIYAVCAHMVPPRLWHVAHTATLQIFGPFIYSFASFMTPFFTLWAIYISPAICLQSDMHTHTYTHSFNNKQYGPLNAIKHPWGRRIYIRLTYKCAGIPQGSVLRPMWSTPKSHQIYILALKIFYFTGK